MSRSFRAVSSDAVPSVADLSGACPDLPHEEDCGTDWAKDASREE